MKRKLGPLQLWQWALIGAILGAGTILYRRGHPAATAAQDALAAATPSDAQYSPIDPTTGLPMSGGFSTGASTGDVPTPTDSSGSSGNSLGDLLANFGQLEELLTGLTEIAPGPALDTSNQQPAQQTGAKRATHKKTARKTAKPKRHTIAGTKNPGHHVTRHGHGRKTAGSSAPHNPRQHQHVQSPAHQRHEPTKHESAQHPAARTPIPAHHTPAVHPPAPRRLPAPKPRKKRR